MSTINSSRWKGANLLQASRYNRRLVLEAIRHNPNISRIKLSRTTGLSGQTISNIVNELIRDGMVSEQGAVPVTNGPGRPRRSLFLNPNGRYAIGIHIDPIYNTVVLLNLEGRILDKEHPSLPEKAVDAMPVLAESVHRLLARNNVLEDRNCGVGIAVPCPLDGERGAKMINPPNLPGWYGTDIAGEMSKMLNMPVSVSKDVTSACYGELWSTPDRSDRAFLFFYLGTGTAAGLGWYGQVLRGRTDNAGEIGHIVVDSNGPQCPICGMRGCLSLTCDPRSIINEACSLGLIPESNSGDSDYSVQTKYLDLIERSKQGDQACRDLLVQVGRRLGHAASILSDFLDVDDIVMGGPYWNLVADILKPEIISMLEKTTVMHQVHRFKVDSAVYGADVAAVGAASSVLYYELAPR